MESVKPCPFCKEENPLIFHDLKSWIVKCRNCGVYNDGFETKKKAIEWWNGGR